MHRHTYIATAVALALSIPLSVNAFPTHAIAHTGAKHHEDAASVPQRHGHLGRTVTNANSNGHFAIDRDRGLARAADRHELHNVMTHPSHSRPPGARASEHRFDRRVQPLANVNSNGRFATARYKGVERADERHDMHRLRRMDGDDRFARDQDDRFARDRDDRIADRRHYQPLRDRDDRMVRDRDDFMRRDRDDYRRVAKDDDDRFAGRHRDPQALRDRDARMMRDRDDYVRKDRDDGYSRIRNDQDARDRDTLAVARSRTQRAGFTDRNERLAVETQRRTTRDQDDRFAWNDRFAQNHGDRFAPDRGNQVALNAGGPQSEHAGPPFTNVNSNGRFAVDREKGLERAEERHEMHAARRAPGSDDRTATDSNDRIRIVKGERGDHDRIGVTSDPDDRVPNSRNNWMTRDTDRDHLIQSGYQVPAQ